MAHILNKISILKFDEINSYIQAGIVPATNLTTIAHSSMRDRGFWNGIISSSGDFVRDDLLEGRVWRQFGHLLDEWAEFAESGDIYELVDVLYVLCDIAPALGYEVHASNVMGRLHLQQGWIIPNYIAKFNRAFRKTGEVDHVTFYALASAIGLQFDHWWAYDEWPDLFRSVALKNIARPLNYGTVNEVK